MWICENSGWNLTDPAALPAHYFMTFYFNSTAISELIIIILNAWVFFFLQIHFVLWQDKGLMGGKMYSTTFITIMLACQLH